MIKTLLYIGLPSNPNFLGAQLSSDVAEVIAKSRGPSGENAEYLFRLEDSLEDLGPGSRDDHVKGLSQKVRKILREQLGSAEGENCHGLEAVKVNYEIPRGDEQAETEKP